MFRFIGGLCGWLFVALFATFLGVVAFHWARSQPRSVLPGWLEIRALTPDGSLILAQVADTKINPQPNVGEFQVWSTHDGKLIRRFPGRRLIQGQLGSPSMGLHQPNPLVARGDDDILEVIDWQQGDIKRIPLRDGADIQRVLPAPDGRWLIVEQNGKNSLLDVSARHPPVVLNRYVHRFTPLPVPPRSFSPDGRWLVLDGDQMIVRELETAQERRLETSPFQVAAIAPNGTIMALARAGEAPRTLKKADEHLRGMLGDMGRWTQSVEFRALPDGAWKGRVDLPEFGLWGIKFAPDNRSAALYRIDSAHGVRLLFVSVPDGRKIAEAAVPGSRWVEYSSDGALVLCTTEMTVPDGEISGGRMIDTATGKTLWTKPAAAWLHFTGAADGSVVFNEDYEHEYQILEGRTGVARVTLSSDFRTANHLPAFTPDGRRLIIRGWRARQREPFFGESILEKWFPALFADDVPGIIVVDADTGQELLRLMNRGQVGEGRYLSDDGAVVITVDGDEETPDVRVLSVWEVSPRRAWTWALFAAALGGAACVTVRAVWRRRRRGPVGASL